MLPSCRTMWAFWRYNSHCPLGQVVIILHCWQCIQDCTKRLFPGFVKLGEKVPFCLPTAGRRTQFFHPILTQPGKHLLVQPCIWMCKFVFVFFPPSFSRLHLNSEEGDQIHLKELRKWKTVPQCGMQMQMQADRRLHVPPSGCFNWAF